jgi:D-alanine-D-alanine ligase
MKKIFVVMGGPSEEHEVSLKTGFEMLTHLDSEKYEISALVISQNRQFFRAKNGYKLTLEELSSPQKSSSFNGPFSPADSVSLWSECDTALLALHGEFGEDGVFQGYLETIGVPHTGSGVFPSAIGMHKSIAKKVFESSGIPTPPYQIYRKNDNVDLIIARLGLPCFVKAPQSGSSKLLGKAENREELESMLLEYIKFGDSVLVEMLIDGEEFSVPVLEINGEPKALSPVYIKPAEGHYFDYAAKYEGLSEEIVPAPFDDKTLDMLKNIALVVHKVLECKGLSRTDIILKDGTPYTIEVNTLPGFTAQSLFPKAFAADGGSFSELLDIIIEEVNNS